MGGLLRIVASGAFLLGLSSCNLVVSKEPWFTQADAQPVPDLRDGLWLTAEPDCRVDESVPAEKWPDCASASFVRGHEQWAMQWTDTDARGRHRRTFAGWELADPNAGGLLVANGDHFILQFQAQGDEGAPPSDQADPGGEEGAPPLYLYAALRLLRRDQSGEVLAMEHWLVQCGPLPDPRRSPARRRYDAGEYALTDGNVTDRPFAGLTVVDEDCTAASADALRNAAVLSEALEPPTQRRWIREGWH